MKRKWLRHNNVKSKQWNEDTKQLNEMEHVIFDACE